MLPGTTYDQCTKVLGSGGMRSSLGGGLPREWKGTRQDSERVGIRPESLAGRVEISGAHTRGAFSTALMKHFAERLRRWNLGLVFISYLHPDRSKETWGPAMALGAHSIHGTTLDNISVTAQKTTQLPRGVWPLRLRTCQVRSHVGCV